MKSVQAARSRKVTNSARKSLSTESIRGLSAVTIPSAPCSCRECKANLKKSQTPRPPANYNNQDKGDFQPFSGRNRIKTPIAGGGNQLGRSNSRQILKTKFFPAKTQPKDNFEPNLVRKSSSSTTVLFPPRNLSTSKSSLNQSYRGTVSRQDSLVQIYKAPAYPSRVSSSTEAVPILRNKFGPSGRNLPSANSKSQPYFEETSATTCTCKSSCCFSVESLDDSPCPSSLQLKSTENVEFASESDCHLIHPAHARRVCLTTQKNRLPPIPPPNPNKVQQPPTSNNRQTTAVLSFGANTVGRTHLNNYHPGQCHSSPSFIVETVGSDSACGNEKTVCTLSKLPFSRDNQLRRPSTSHSTLHGTESCTNLHAELLTTSDPTQKCPLCKETKSQVRVHHHSMQSRYMTDLEWRICHAVNIYVYRNGVENQTPILVHIPPARKKNMKHVMAVIQDRMRYPIGYANSLYKMDGTRIRHPCELEMYNNYVVGSNYDKHFKCVQYGRKRSPLLVLARESKHVRVLRAQNEHYDHWLIKKKAAGDERPQYVYPVLYTKDGYGPADLPVGQGGNYQPCGPFCKLSNRQCGPMNHENCGPDPPMKAFQSGRQGPEYAINTMTIPTHVRDPVQLLQERDKQGYEVSEADDSKNKNSEVTRRRFKAIGKDDERLFYGTKPRKKSKGVVDITGDKKLFGTREQFDLNANLLQNEYDEIPDFSDPNPQPQYNAELELCEVVDESEEGQQQQQQDDNSQDSPPQSSPPPRQSRTVQSKQSNKTTGKNNNASISATSRSYTIVTKTSPPVQQGGTQTKSGPPAAKPKIVNGKNRQAQRDSSGPAKPQQRKAKSNLSPEGSGVAFFVPISSTSAQPQHTGQNSPNETQSEQQIDCNSVRAAESVSSASQGFHLQSNLSGVSGTTCGEEQQEMWQPYDNNNMESIMGNPGQQQQQHMQQQQNMQQQQPAYPVGILNQGSPYRPFIIDGSARFASNAPYYVSRDPEPQENFANKYDELSDIMTGIDEVDIPYTPIEGKSRNTYQPPPNFYPPYQDSRFLPNGCTYLNGFNQPVQQQPCRTTIDKPKVRNVATQFGVPSVNDIPYANTPQGQQQMLQDSFQNQQLLMQQALLQQQQFAAQLASTGPIMYQQNQQSPVYHSSGAQLQQQGQQQQYMQPMPQQPRPMAQVTSQNTHWNNSVQMQQRIQQVQNMSIPPPTQFRDIGNNRQMNQSSTFPNQAPVNCNGTMNSSTNQQQQLRTETMNQGRRPQQGQQQNNNAGRIS